jgi:hypothetical protein
MFSLHKYLHIVNVDEIKMPLIIVNKKKKKEMG